MNFLLGLLVGFLALWPMLALLLTFTRMLQLWRVLPECTVLVYTLFGRVIGEVREPGLFSPLARFGPRALLIPWFGKTYSVSTALAQSYLRNQLVNSEEGAPMGVGIWYEKFVQNPTAFLFQNSDPAGSLRANVATAVSKQLSNLRLEILLEDRDALSQRVREEVSPASVKWGYQLGSTYIRKVAFRDKGMIHEIERKVVNRLRQVTAAMKQDGDNKVALLHSDAEKKASQRFGEAQAIRPKIVGEALARIQKNPEVAEALFRLLEIQATARSTGKITLTPAGGGGVLLQA